MPYIGGAFLRTMIKTFNKHQRWLMIVIAILSIPFVFYFVQRPDYASMRSNVYGRLYGRNVSQVEVDRGERMFDLARDLGMSDFLQDLVGNPQTEREAKEQFAVNLLILQHEAEALGIRPTQEQTAAALAQVRAFRGENGFDLKKYNDAVQNYLGPRGFSEAQMEELAGDQVTLRRIKELLGTGTAISARENKANFETAFGKFDVSVVRVQNSEVAKEVKLSDDDVKKYYDAHKDELKSDEKRKVQFISLALSDAQKKLAGRERVDALQKLADKANDVHDALAQKGADFGAVAAKFQLPVVTTGDFTAAAPDPQLKDPQLADSAFQLTKEEPTSDPLQGADGFYILHLAGVTPAQPLTMEAAKPRIVEALTASRSREMLTMRAIKIAHDLRDTLKGGEPLATALQKANLKAEKIEPFTLMEDIDAKTPPAPNASPDLPLIKRAVADLKSNEVSDPLPARDGMLIAVVEKHEPPDASHNADRGKLEERALQGKRSVAFQEWLRERRRAAGVAETKEQAS